MDNYEDNQTDIDDISIDDFDGDQELENEMIDAFSKDLEIDEDDDLQYEENDDLIPDEISEGEMKIDSTTTRLPDVISKYQLTPLIITRTRQLIAGAQPFVVLENGDHDPKKIALAEIAHGVFPLALLIDDKIICRMSHFTVFPSEYMNQISNIKSKSYLKK